MEAKDIRGIVIEPGDLVCVGYDNGSSLHIGTVTKVTEKKTFINATITSHYKYDEDDYISLIRDHNRVAVIKKNR